jgi:glutathione synthase/RimK-type ligase-like ATP-grasp enzyme
MIVFIVLNSEGGYSRRIAQAVERNGRKTTMLSWQDFDYTVIRQLDPHRDAIFFRTGAAAAVRIARAFEGACFNVINDSRYIRLSGQKHLANVYANANGIAIPSLNVTIKKDNTELLSLYLKQNGPLVAKPIVSRDMGRYVFLIKTEADFTDVAGIPGSHILLQSEVKFDRLVRTIVTSDGMLVEATTYDTAHDTWKATVCENPFAKHYGHVPKELIEIAEKTIRVFGGHVAYIDYFETSNGFVLNEINHSCGLMEHERISGYPIAEEIGKFLAKFQEASAPGYATRV